MKTFTSVLLAAATVMSVSATQPAQLSRSLNQQQFGQVSLKKPEMPTVINGKVIEKKKLLALPNNKNTQQRIAAKPLGEEKVEVLYDNPFAFCTEGSEDGPYVIALDDEFNVPADVIGADNYGFGGFDLEEAGEGVVYLPFYARIGGFDYYNMMWSPNISLAANITVTVDLKIANLTAETDDFYAVAYTPGAQVINQDGATISQKWQTYTFNIDMTTYSDPYYVGFQANSAADVMMKNLKIAATIPPVAIPVVSEATGYNGSSFTCNWQPAEGATSYLLTLVEYDQETEEIVDYVFEDQKVEGTSYLVTGLDPEKVYKYFVAATDGQYTTAYGKGMLVNMLINPTNIIIDATPGQTLKAKWEPSIAANYYVAVANRTTEVAAGTDYPFADANFADYTCGGTLDDPILSDYVYTEMPEMPGWQFILGAGIDGAYGVSYNYIYELYLGITAGVQSDPLDLSKVKNGTVSVSIEAASGLDCGMSVAVASYDEELGGYVMADFVQFIDEPVPSEFTKYEFNLSGCTDNSYFIIAPNPMGRDDSGTLVGNLFFKSIKVNGVFGSTSDLTLSLGQKEGPETEAEFATEVIDGDRYSVAVRAFTVNDQKTQIYRQGSIADYTTVTAAAGIQNVSVANQGEVRYYNLQGIEVAQPESGLYIRVNGNKATKILKK